MPPNEASTTEAAAIAIANPHARATTPNASAQNPMQRYPHGMLTTHADVLNPDLLAFIRS